MTQHCQSKTFPRRHLPPLAKLALEMGPLVLFFLANAFGERFGLEGDQTTYAAIGLFVAATVVSLAIHFALLRRVPIMPSSRGVVVLVFGGSPWRSGTRPSSSSSRPS